MKRMDAVETHKKTQQKIKALQEQLATLENELPHIDQQFEVELRRLTENLKLEFADKAKRMEAQIEIIKNQIATSQEELVELETQIELDIISGKHTIKDALNSKLHK
jgi:archaellum component FlaC